MLVGRELLEELGEPAVLTNGEGNVSTISVIVRDRGTRSRIGRGVVLTSDASAIVSDETPIMRGATIEFEGTVFRVDGRQLGAPGTLELSLSRQTGERVETRGVGDDIIEELGVPVSYKGNEILAHVMRTGVETEINKNGILVETVRTVLTARVADVDGIRPKDEITLDGRVYRVRVADRTGFGTIRITLD